MVARISIAPSGAVIKIGILVSLAALYSVASSEVQAVVASPNLLMRFQNDTLEAWKLTEAADESPGSIKVTTKIFTYSNGQLTKREEKAALLRRKAGYYLFEPTQSRGGIRDFFGKNPRYSYSVSKDDDSADYALSEVRLKGQQRFGQIPLDLVQYFRPNSYGFIPSLGALSKIVRSPHFKALRAEEIDRRFIRVHFETAIVIPHKQLPVKGWMDFDPNNAWALQRSKYETSPGSTSEFIKVFSSSEGPDYRPCQSWEAIHKSIDGDKWEMKQETQFEILDAHPPPDEIFTLSHYGLPEPIGISPPDHPRIWLWLLMAALAAAAVAILFARLKRLRKLSLEAQAPRPSTGRQA